MKPDWKDAPEWVKWTAMDGDGDWWWYEVEPHWTKLGFWTYEKGRARFARHVGGATAEFSKERRP